MRTSNRSSFAFKPAYSHTKGNSVPPLRNTSTKRIEAWTHSPRTRYQNGPRARAHQLKLNLGGRGWWYKVAMGSSLRDGPISISKTLRTPRRIAPPAPASACHTLAIRLTTPLLPLPLRLPRLRPEPWRDAPQAPADWDGGQQLSSPRSAGR